MSMTFSMRSFMCNLLVAHSPNPCRRKEQLFCCMSAIDDRQGEAVPPLAADRLDCRGAEAPLIGERVEEAPGSRHRRVAVLRIGHPALAHHIVGDDHGAGARQLDGPLKIVPVALL